MMRFIDMMNSLEKKSTCPLFNRLYEKANLTAGWLSAHHISPNIITLFGLFFAILGVNFLAIESYFAALICLLLNRLCDIFDGIAARQQQITPFGAFLDIFADYSSTSLFVFGFVLAIPNQNAVSGAFMLATLTISVASLLGFSLIAKQDYRILNRSGFKICMWGAVQNFDSFIALFLMCILPQYFMPIAIFFGLLSLGKSLLIVSGAYYHLEITKKVKPIK